MIYNGSNGYPNILSYVKTGLTASQAYKFMVAAAYTNGVTANSSEVTVYTCSAPSGLEAPTRSAGTSTSMTLDWAQPSSNGGCAISGFKLYINDGAGGTVFNEIDAGTVNNNPSLSQHTTTTFPGASVGNTFVFYIEVLNVVGSATSNTVGFILADVPDTPTVAPTSDASVTTQSILKIDTATVAGNGGAAILSYSLEVDSGNGRSY